MSKEKVLVVIPAYNEEENILNVIKEIKKDKPKNFDILVINDCSSDNTENILIENNVLYLSNIFNMKYAMSIQTGIKYAYYNNYDYVIQMDADGQHIFKEALKLYEQIKKTNSDIVIGSRYLKDSEYSSLKIRRFGTKIFEIMIKIFCNKKITDPLSGLQCLNKKVIEKYALKGEYPEYPDANLVIEMILKGYKIEEIPVKMRNRENGVSMHSGIIGPIKYMVNMFYTILFIVIQNIGKKRVKK